MADIFEIAGRIHSTSQEKVTTTADEILDASLGMKQNELNAEIASIGAAVQGLSPEQTEALSVSEKANSNEAKIGYYLCDTTASTAAKTVSSTTYTLGLGGSVKIKFEHANIAASGVTLKIGSTEAKPLYYGGAAVSVNNTWEDNETVEVYYDGTNYYANNVAGGSGDGIFDLTAKTGNTYATLDDALTAANTVIPASKKKGGMSILFVQSSDNKYVQFRYMGTATTGSPNPFLDTANWQGVDDVPTAGSKNLVESGGVYEETKKVKNVSFVRLLETTEGVIEFYTDNDEYIGHLDSNGFHASQYFIQNSKNGDMQNLYSLIMGSYTKNLENIPTISNEKTIEFYTDNNEYIGHLDDYGFHAGHFLMQSSKSGESTDMYSLIMSMYIKNIENKSTFSQESMAEIKTDNDEYVGHWDDEGLHVKELFVQQSKGGNAKNISEYLNVELIIPDDIYVLSDRISQFFYSGFIKTSDYSKFAIDIECTIAKNYKRYIEINPSAAGNYSLKITVAGDNGNVYAEKTCIVHVISPFAPSNSKNILVVGASNIEPGDTVAELWRMINTDDGTPQGLDFGNVNMVGSHRGTVTAQTYPDVYMEAHGGWSWNTYLSGSLNAIRMQVSSSTGTFNRGDLFVLFDSEGTQRYATYQLQEDNLTAGIGNVRLVSYNGGSITTNPYAQTGTLYKIEGTGVDMNTSIAFSSWAVESFAPFVNNGQFTFLPYIQEFCNGSVDVLVCNLGINQLVNPSTSVDTVIEDACTFIEKFHTECPTSKVILNMPFLFSPLYPTKNYYYLLSKFQDYNKRLMEIGNSSDYSEYVSICPVNIFIDIENQYPTEEKNVDLRSTEKELVGTNQLHPLASGRLQVSDAILPILLSIF